MISLPYARPCRVFAATLLLVLASGCGALRSTEPPQPFFYSLDNARAELPEATPGPEAGANGAAVKSRRWRDGDAAPTLIVNSPHAASGFDSQRIIYVREAHKLEYFAHSEWVDTPARMIEPLIIAAIESSATFRAVVLTPSAAAGDLRLDTEIIRLQQDFASPPSHVRFTLRAYLVNNTTRRVLGWREFDETVAATSADPYGGVVAANRVVRIVLQQLASFCTEAAGLWLPSSAER